MTIVTLSNGVHFDSIPKKTILESALDSGVAIEYSCKNGRCGACRAIVKQGDTHILYREEFKLKESNEILTCCREASTDIELSISDLGRIGLIPITISPARVDSTRMLNETVMELILRLPPSCDFDYVAGQYVNLIFDGKRRSYSIANAHRLDHKLEFHIKKVANGFMSNYFFYRCNQNDLLRIEGPLGTFSIRDDNSRNIVFLATGTGIAPIKSMLENLDESYEKNVYVFWGARYEKDFYEINSISNRINIFYCTSREKLEGKFFGYVQNAVLELNINLDETTVYACGSSEMILSAQSTLTSEGLKLENFYADAFVSSG